jgi:hypothetical protein
VPSFSVLTALLLDPRLLSRLSSVTIVVLVTTGVVLSSVALETLVRTRALYAVSFSHGPSEHHKRSLWVSGDPL